ncbi:hypothetical protein C7447_10466 [Tenacibaculum adriaticum]|uniref:Uncharacterized protein n=1 Tax=Tenacibaculum adriaticum TaxID=413713 RepID=A0A5S5DNC3_9FLAO|nr:hypothetical protein [Tenacibaculum adriaticum]TYP97381.1 hypothetical protein C7447_10466 [Tenacibaculum adriaticum]
MMTQFLPSVSWGNGAFMIAIFALVCVVLIAAVLLMVLGGKQKKKS